MIRIFLLVYTPDLVIDGGNEYCHKRTDNIEETIGEVGKCGYSEDAGLGGATSIPWDQD